MGAHVAKPKPAESTEAKANADLAMEGMDASADNFLSSIRLGEASVNTLGYPLTDQKLLSQEVHRIVQSEANAPSHLIKDSIDAIFSTDWKAVTTIAASALASFFGDSNPVTTDFAVNDEFSKSFLLYEFGSVVQYSIYVRRTNASSVGTLLQNSLATLQCVICKGNVDFAKVDPQTVVTAVMQSGDLTEDEEQSIWRRIETALGHAAELARIKKELEAGVAFTAAAPQTAAFEAETVVTTLEEARHSAISSTQRFQATSNLPKNILFNGSVMEPGDKKEIALNTSGGFNAVAYNGENYVCQTMLSPEPGEELSFVINDNQQLLLNTSIPGRVVLQCDL